MAKIVFMPDQHRCRDELSSLGPQPVGTVAECSCGNHWAMRDSQFDSPYWEQQPKTAERRKGGATG